MASIVELRDMSDDEIREMMENAREEMFNLRFQNASARLEDVSRIKSVRREIAQLQTVLHMRQLAIQEAAKSPEVAEALAGKKWSAEATFSYEDSLWVVSFVDEDGDDLVEGRVNLNKKKNRSRKARQVARR
ncbi:MAG: 50S ribosomal protein L29 [Chloroflexota bacterium]|jgi:large subunit ribosomal protein L29